MSRFIKKIGLFLSLLIIILSFINYRYVNSEKYKSMNSTNKFSKVPQNIEIANLGTSHGQYAFVYDELDKVGFNFAMPAQRLYYDEKILEKYIHSFKEDADLIIPISYISFYLGYDNENFEEFNKVYYPILGARDIKNLTLSNYLKYKALPILTAESNIKYAFIKDDTVYEEKVEYRNYTTSEEKMEEEAKDTATRHLEFIEEGRKNKEEFANILDDIIRISLENNINPVITTTPFTKYYNDYFTEEFYEEFTSIIDEVLEKYPDIQYLDYSHDERFINSPEYFFDSSHLNLTGGKYFTEIILSDLKK